MSSAEFETRVKAWIVELQGELLAHQLVQAQLMRYLRAKGVLTEAEVGQVYEDVLRTFETKGPDDSLSRHARRSIERMTKPRKKPQD